MYVFAHMCSIMVQCIWLHAHQHISLLTPLLLHLDACSYGAHFKDVDLSKKASKITFDD
jgi:hypothetical protein